MSTEYEQQDQPDNGFEYDGIDQNDDDAKPSSGLIRAAIFGVLLFLAVIGMASVINNWFRGPSDVDQKLAVIDAQTENAEGVSPYKRLEQSWIDTRALLESELQNKRNQLENVTKLEAQIETAQEETVRAENGVSVALQAVEKAQAELEVLSEKESDLENQTPADAFEGAQLAASAAAEAAEAAKAKFDRARQEQKRIETTVVELRRAASAADAAANASRLVVSAADAAKQAVTENQDVMSEADGPALTNLENNFFNDAEQQAVNMERSADAARQAVDVAELRLASLKREEDAFQEQFSQADAERKTTEAALAQVEKDVEEHLLKMEALRQETDTAQTRLRAAERQAEDKKEEMAAAAREVEVLKGKVETAKASIDKADDTLKIVEQKFQETEAELKKLHRARAEQNAVIMASANANLTEKLRVPLGGAAPDHPIFDRLVFSSAKLFEAGSAVLDDGGKDILLQAVPVLEEVIAELPQDLDWVLRVDGHTDNQPISGTGRFKDNWELSQARALAVVRFLVESTDLQPQQLSANGYGEFQPLTQDTTASALAKNRRIELTLAAH